MMDTNRGLDSQRRRPSPAISLATLCAKTLQDVEPFLSRRGQSLRLALPGGVAWLTGNEAGARQVVQSLVRVVALLADGRGELTFAAEIDAASQLSITISGPRGAGRAPHDDAEAGREMAVARQRLVRLGGSLADERWSGPEIGLTVLLPIRLREGASIGRPLREPSAGPARILFAEDDDDNAEGPIAFLRLRGYEVHRACNGHEALALAREIHPSLIVMDIQMPQLDGLAAIELIRLDRALAATPIVAVTALATPADEARCYLAGADLYLAKPYSLRTLLAVIEARLSAPAASA